MVECEYNFYFLLKDREGPFDVWGSGRWKWEQYWERKVNKSERDQRMTKFEVKESERGKEW